MTGALRVMIVTVIAGAASTAGPIVVCAAAQQRFTYIGPKQCTNCHDHEPEKLWYEKKEIPEVHRLFPEQNNAGHINSLKQLETPKSEQFAKAVGLADKYDPAGSCAVCHATVFKGDVNAGVSCESCHGPASGYVEPHQKKDAYETSVTQFGMTRLVGNFAGWTQQCTNCHVMTDERLIAAGHPSGDDFDLSKKYVPVSLHFKKTYAPADVEAIARAEMQAALRRRRATATTTAPAAPAETPEPAAGGTRTPAAAAPAEPTAVSPGTAAPAPVARPAEAPAESVAPAGKPAPSSTSAAATRAPRPRQAPRIAPIDPANPPAGSPTSIEPPPLATAGDVAPPSATTTSPAAPMAAPAAPTSVPSAVAVRTNDASRYLWIVVAIALVAAAIVVLARKRR